MKVYVFGNEDYSIYGEIEYCKIFNTIPQQEKSILSEMDTPVLFWDFNHDNQIDSIIDLSVYENNLLLIQK